MLKSLSMTLGVLGVAGLANDAAVFAAPRRPIVAAATDQTVQIPRRNAGYGGTNLDGDNGVPVPTGDSVPYHLTGSVVYEHTGYTPAPRSLGVAIKEIHLIGWFDADGHYPYPCGKFTIDARHLSINGQDYSGRLEFEGGIYPRGQPVSRWVLRFPASRYPTFPTSANWPRPSPGVTIGLRANVAYDGACIPTGNRSLTTSVVIR